MNGNVRSIRSGKVKTVKFETVQEFLARGGSIQKFDLRRKRHLRLAYTRYSIVSKSSHQPEPTPPPSALSPLDLAC